MGIMTFLRSTRHLLLPGALAAGFLLAGCAAPYPRDQEKALAQVTARLEKGELQAAEAEARWTMEAFPGSSRALSVWALAAKALALSRTPPDMDLLDEAEARCLQAGETRPRDPVPWFALGVIRRDRGDLGGAIQAWEEALKAEPFHRPTLQALADLQFSLGHERAALVLYDRLLRLPRENMKRTERALYSARLGACLLADVEISPRPTAKDYDPAQKAFRSALDLDPGQPEASRWMAWLVVRRSRLLGRWKEPDLRREDAARAESFLRKSLSLHPGSPGLLHDLGWLRAVQGDRKGAEEDYRKALALDPGFVPALVDLAALLEEEGRGKPGEVEALRRKALGLTGDFSLARALRRSLGGGKRETKRKDRK